MSRIYSSLSGGELFEKITSEGYSMSEAEVINYMRQICEGVKHMHERNIIHLGNYYPFFMILKMIFCHFFVHQPNAFHVCFSSSQNRYQT